MFVNMIIITLITIIICIRQFFYINCECRLRNQNDRNPYFSKDRHLDEEYEEDEEDEEDEDDEEDKEEEEEDEEEEDNQEVNCSKGCACEEVETDVSNKNNCPLNCSKGCLGNIEDNNSSDCIVNQEDESLYADMPPLLTMDNTNDLRDQITSQDED